MTWGRVKGGGEGVMEHALGGGGEGEVDGESYDRSALEIVNGRRQLTNVGGPWVVMSARNGRQGWSGGGWRRQGVEERG